MRTAPAIALAALAALVTVQGNAQQAQPAAPGTGETAAASGAAPDTAAEPAEKPEEDGAPETTAQPAEQPAGSAPHYAAEPAEKPDAVVDAAQRSAAPAGPLEFRTMVGNKPIEIPDDDVTPAFEEFRRTGENPFAGDEEALAEGRKIYARLCQACHLPDGSGRIGPSLRDELWRHPGLDTEAGRFAIIHSGGAGAMQAFDPRMDLDEILKVMAYTDTFREDDGS